MSSFMVRHLLVGLILGLFGLTSSVACASEDLGVTMRMVTDDETLTDSVVREIRLDRPVNLETGPERGGDVAREARENGRAFGEAVSERAREAARLRQEVGRPERPEAPGNQGPPEGIPNGAVR
ncbi:hypothetical protein [Marinobacter halotolerans]|uniref:hypothetical protein n=1 Tax=Marinobacter halotolerans TaxID=1569211 RepID=UPI00124527E4|nr:hypothetical protein [Marinobacter halotolerans]